MAGTSRQPLTMIPRATTPSARGVARTAERRTEGPANARRRSPGGSRRGGAGEVARRKAAAAGGHYYGRRSSPSPVVVSAAWFFLLLNLKDESWTAKVPCCRFSLPLRFWRRNLASGSAAVSVFLAPRTRPVRHRCAGRYRSRRLLLARAATTRRRRAWDGQVGRKSCPPAPPIAAMCWAACRRARSRLRGAVRDPPRRSNQPRSGLLCQFLAGRRRRDMDHSGVLIASRLLAPVVRRAGKTHVFALGGLLFGSNVPEHRLNVVVEPGGVWPSFGNPGATGRGGARGACDTARFLVEDGWVTDAQVRRLREKRMAGKMLAAGR